MKHLRITPIYVSDLHTRWTRHVVSRFSESSDTVQVQ